MRPGNLLGGNGSDQSLLPRILSIYFCFDSWSVCEISSEFIEKWLFYNDFRFFHLLSFWVSAQLIGPILLHVKRHNSSICKCFQDIAWTFFSLWVVRSVIHLSKKWKDNLPWWSRFLSILRSLRDSKKKIGLNPTGVIRYLGSVLGSLWQNSPHKDAVFCISLTNIDQCWITCTFKVE